MHDSSEILLIVSNSTPDPGDPLLDALASAEFQVVFAGSCREAHRRLRLGELVAVVVCDLSLSDGNWCDLIRIATSVQSGARIVLRTESADERLWSEALWRGVYDLLIEPFSAQEAHRVIEGAGRAVHYHHPEKRRPVCPETAVRGTDEAAALHAAAGSALGPEGAGRKPMSRPARSVGDVEDRLGRRPAGSPRRFGLMEGYPAVS